MGVEPGLFMVEEPRQHGGAVEGQIGGDLKAADAPVAVEEREALGHPGLEWSFAGDVGYCEGILASAGHAGFSALLEVPAREGIQCRRATARRFAGVTNRGNPDVFCLP